MRSIAPCKSHPAPSRRHSARHLVATRRARSGLALSCLAALTFVSSLTARGAEPRCADLREWIPDDVVAVATSHDLGKHLRALLSGDLLRRLESTTVGKLVVSRDEFQKGLRELKRFEEISGSDPVDLADDLLGLEVAVGLRLSLFAPEVIVLTRTRGTEQLAKARAALERTIEHREGALPATEKIDVEGVPVEKLDKVLFTNLGPILMISSSKSLLQESLRLAKGERKEALSSSPLMARLDDAFRDDRLLSVAVRPRYIPNYEVPERAENAVASLLISGFLGALETSDLLAASLRVEDNGLRLDIDSVDSDRGLAEKFEAFFPTVAESDLRARLEKRGVLAAVELHRDLAQWWEHAEGLLESRAFGDLSQANQTLSLFFGGESFRDDILPQVKPRVLLVAKNQSYEALGAIPQPAIPGIAIVFEIENAEKLGRQLRVAFNGFVSIVNLDRMQKKKDAPTMLVSPVLVGETEVLSVDLGLGDKGQPGIEQNFTPSLSVAGDRLIISSNLELARLLVEEIAASSKSTRTNVSGTARDRLVISADEAHAIVSSNLDFFAAQNMVKKGVSLEEARGEISAVLELVSLLEDFQISTRRKDDQLRVSARLRLDRNAASTRTVQR